MYHDTNFYLHTEISDDQTEIQTDDQIQRFIAGCSEPEGCSVHCDFFSLKGFFNTKMSILSSITYPHIVPNLYEFISYVEHKRDILKTVGNQTVLTYSAMEANGNQ